MPAISLSEMSTLLETKLAKEIRAKMARKTLQEQLTMLFDQDPPPGRGARIRLYGHPLDKSTSHE